MVNGKYIFHASRTERTVFLFSDFFFSFENSKKRWIFIQTRGNILCQNHEITIHKRSAWLWLLLSGVLSYAALCCPVL
jgi:hypothetical protein